LASSSSSYDVVGLATHVQGGDGSTNASGKKVPMQGRILLSSSPGGVTDRCYRRRSGSMGFEGLRLWASTGAMRSTRLLAQMRSELLAALRERGANK
jgi:hypothetical protein